MGADMDNLLHLLRGGPRCLRAVVRAIPPAGHAWTDGPGRWSVHEVVAHMTQVEESGAGWIPRLFHLLDGVPGPLPRVDALAGLPSYTGLDMPRLLRRFSAARRAGLRRLEAGRPGPTDLSRDGVHPDLGRVEAGQMLATWAMHDQAHLAQIIGIVAANHAVAVGPFAAYLRIVGASRPVLRVDRRSVPGA